MTWPLARAVNQRSCLVVNGAARRNNRSGESENNAGSHHHLIAKNITKQPELERPLWTFNPALCLVSNQFLSFTIDPYNIKQFLQDSFMYLSYLMPSGLLARYFAGSFACPVLSFPVQLLTFWSPWCRCCCPDLHPPRIMAQVRCSQPWHRGKKKASHDGLRLIWLCILTKIWRIWIERMTIVEASDSEGV